MGNCKKLRRLLEQPVGVSAVTILLFSLPNELTEPDGNRDAVIYWESLHTIQVKGAFVVLSWSGHLSIFNVCHHVNI